MDATVDVEFLKSELRLALERVEALKIVNARQLATINNQAKIIKKLEADATKRAA